MVAQQLQAAVRVDWSSVKSTQLAAPALFSRHVAILVPVGINFCRKREWDLTHNHFPLKTVHCEGLSVYHSWCKADSDIVRLFEYLLIQNLDGSLTDSIPDDKDNRSIVSDDAVRVCVFVCLFVCLFSNYCHQLWISLNSKQFVLHLSTNFSYILSYEIM